MGMKNEKRARAGAKGGGQVGMTGNRSPVSIHGIPCIRIIIDSMRRVEEIGRAGLRFPRRAFALLNVPAFFEFAGI